HLDPGVVWAEPRRPHHCGHIEDLSVVETGFAICDTFCSRDSLDASPTDVFRVEPNQWVTVSVNALFQLLANPRIDRQYVLCHPQDNTVVEKTEWNVAGVAS